MKFSTTLGALLLLAFVTGCDEGARDTSGARGRMNPQDPNVQQQQNRGANTGTTRSPASGMGSGATGGAGTGTVTEGGAPGTGAAGQPGTGTP